MQNLPALRRSCSLLVGCIFAAAPLSSIADAPAQTVTLDVTFKLTDQRQALAARRVVQALAAAHRALAVMLT
jgi:hypothetical protein